MDFLKLNTSVFKTWKFFPPSEINYSTTLLSFFNSVRKMVNVSILHHQPLAFGCKTLINNKIIQVKF